MKTLILYLILSHVPIYVSDQVEAAFTRWASYESFRVERVQPADTDPDVIVVDYADLPGSRLGEAYCRCWGHEQNRIVIDIRAWEPDALMNVVMHEIGHIVLAQYAHSYTRFDLMTPSITRPYLLRLHWNNINKLVEIYGAARVIPQFTTQPNFRP